MYFHIYTIYTSCSHVQNIHTRSLIYKDVGLNDNNYLQWITYIYMLPRSVQKLECPRHWILYTSNALLKTPVSIIISLFAFSLKSVHKILVENWQDDNSIKSLCSAPVMLSKHSWQKKKKSQILVSGPSVISGWKELRIRAASAAQRWPNALLYQSGVLPLKSETHICDTNHNNHFNHFDIWYMLKTWKRGLLHVYSADVGQSGLPWTTGLQ